MPHWVQPILEAVVLASDARPPVRTPSSHEPALRAGKRSGARALACLGRPGAWRRDLSSAARR
jgi:hypothetical protein